MHQHGGHVVTQEGVYDKDTRNDAHGDAHGAAADLQDQNDQDNSHHFIPEQYLAVIGDPGDEPGVVEHGIQTAQQGEYGTNGIQIGGAVPGRRLGRRNPEKADGQQDTQGDSNLDHGQEHTKERGVEHKKRK